MFIWASVWSDVILYFHAFNYCRPLRNSKLLNQPLPSQKQRQLPLNRKKNLRKKRYVEIFSIKLLIANSCFLGGWWSLCNSITILKFSPWQYHLKGKKNPFPLFTSSQSKISLTFFIWEKFFSYWCLHCWRWKYELPAFSLILNLCQLQINDSNVEEKDVELVMQQANVSKSKVWY